MDDEKYYQTVAEELRANRINDALWTKAIAKSQGDENKTKAMYIQLRVEQLVQEEKRSRLNQTLVDDAAADGEGTAASSGTENNEAKQKARLIVHVIIFVIGLLVIWKILFPWVREMKRQMGE